MGGGGGSGGGGGGGGGPAGPTDWSGADAARISAAGPGAALFAQLLGRGMLP
jgi:hypothetical protein